MSKPLYSLAGFLAAQRTLNWYSAPEPAAVVVRSAHVRWRLQREISDARAGFNYPRVEALGTEGVSAADVDSREFAQSLVEALADHLTPRNLRHLADAFAQAYARETNSTPADAGGAVDQAEVAIADRAV